WFVRYRTGNDPNSGVDDGMGHVDALDIEFERAPYPGLRDDDWLIIASAAWDLPAGRYAFTLERDCELTISAGGAEIRTEADADGPDHLRVVVDHGGGQLNLTITAIDRQGPFLLRWV
ncbi:MAG: hypothetical protein M0R74_18580, partial [Dehalococcoidia bacterium]|nr:hypothetical protein [Dehalococcoidia bacterium]